ncbi:hypothetical protein ACFCXH_24540 [Streptomyces nojiriensis]|uniref:hypothetical protein n=1 Tax=Streptomyces nojiriensis TaxID=66374 RepID=UPI0035DBE9D9
MTALAVAGPGLAELPRRDPVRGRGPVLDVQAVTLVPGGTTVYGSAPALSSGVPPCQGSRDRSTVQNTGRPASRAACTRSQRGRAPWATS